MDKLLGCPIGKLDHKIGVDYVELLEAGTVNNSKLLDDNLKGS